MHLVVILIHHEQLLDVLFAKIIIFWINLDVPQPLKPAFGLRLSQILVIFAL
jgi:hypothetical protein